MRTTLWLDVKRALAEALDLPASRREAFVREHCPDERLRGEVLRLLRWRERIDAHGRRPPHAAANGAEARTAPPRAASAPPPDLARGDVLAGRYELGERLGLGAFGAVYRARDLVTGEAVAVKALRVASDAERRSLRREVTVLRRARVPGVVEMLDDWTEDARAFVVMRLVEGEPFPGIRGADRVPWDVLAPRAIDLLQAIGRLHWVGVLHRDIKPENVLVAEGGGVTIVDLGIARDVEAFQDAGAGYVLGTPCYLAPERLVGGPATAATDIYSAGVMIYEALAGRPPREPRNFGEFVRTRREVPPSVSEFAPSVPRHVAAAVDSMVHPDLARRPRSARVAVALLEAGTAAATAPRLPWLGDDAAVRAVVDAVRSARCADVGGPQGSGRSRTLDEAERRLAADGFRVARTVPSAAPYGSVLAAIGRESSEGGTGPPGSAQSTRRRMAALLAARVAVFADDWEAVDPASRGLLLDLADHGSVVRVVDGAPPGAIVPAPIPESSLRALFRGPDRFFHLCEDGARELHRRTGGLPGAMSREIDAWIEAGIALFERGRVVAERSGLDRLEAPFAVSLPHSDAAHDRFPPSALDVAGVLETAGCPLPPALVAGLLGVPVEGVRRDMETLAAAGVMKWDAAGDAMPVAALGSSAGWPEARLRAVHDAAAAAAATPPEFRVHHLLGANRPVDALRAACALAERESSGGRLPLALSALHEAVRALHAAPSPDAADTDAVADLFVRVALAAATQDVLRTTCWELSRIQGRTPVLDDMERIARAALLTIEGQARRAIGLLDVMRSPGTACVMRHRNTVRVFASRLTHDPAERRAALCEAARWARRGADVDAHAGFSESLAWERYAQGRFRVAARLHARSARRHTKRTARVSATLSAASAAMEAGELTWAEDLAREAQVLATAMRHPLHEVRAWTLLRCVAYRRGEPMDPDLEVVEDLEGRVPPGVSGIAFINEAAIAWRTGRLAVTARTAAAAAAEGDRARNPGIAILARALGYASGGPGADGPPPVPADTPGVPAEVRLQALALLVPFADVAPTPADAAALRALPPTSSRRREVLGDDEVRARLATFLDDADPPSGAGGGS